MKQSEERLNKGVIAISAALAAVGALAAAYYAHAGLAYQKEVAAQSKVTITGPANAHGQSCAQVLWTGVTEVSGNAHLVRDDQLWLLIQAPGIGRFYLATRHAVPVRDDHGWDQPIQQIGGKDDSNAKFAVVAVAANLDAANTFGRLLNTPGSEAVSLPSLPSGAHVADQICVQRSD